MRLYSLLFALISMVTGFHFQKFLKPRTSISMSTLKLNNPKVYFVLGGPGIKLII
jgi:hypothetical protein